MPFNIKRAKNVEVQNREFLETNKPNKSEKYSVELLNPLLKTLEEVDYYEKDEVLSNLHDFGLDIKKQYEIGQYDININKEQR
jgi:hypothetical protein